MRANGQAFSRMVRVVTSTLAVLALLSGDVASAGVTAVLSSPHDEFGPSAGPGHLVWTQNSAERPRHYDSFIKPDGEPKIKLNAGRSSSYGAAMDGTTVLYQHVTRSGSDLKLYDIGTGTRTDPPPGVNTGAWEYEPGISGGLLFFTRYTRRRTRLILFDMATETGRVLDAARSSRSYLISNQVNGDWATWERCRLRSGVFSDCQVFLHRISTQEATRIPNPGLQQYGSAVGPDGTVYFVRTGGARRWTCGARTRLVRYPLGGPEAVIARLPRRIDAFAAFAFAEEDASTTLYFDRIDCDRGEWGDIYKLEGAGSA
jgi:hypothetical protein